MLIARSLRYAVLGGGALGLTLALRLTQRGHDVVLFEREEQPGGLAAGFPLGNAHLEKFYHHLFRTDKTAVSLVRELGLDDQLVWDRPVTAVYRDRALWQLDSPRSVLQFGPLAVTSRLRLAVAAAYLKAQPGYQSFENHTAAEWIERWMGHAAYETLWEPLLASKFGDRRQDIAMPWFWARVHYRTSRLGYLRGGFQQLYDTLAHACVARGADLRFGSEVLQVEPSHREWRVISAVRSDLVDRVVSTLPTRLTMRLVPALPSWYRERYEQVEAYGAMCLILELDRPLTNAYWINLNDSGFPFQPLVEHTNLMPATAYRGRAIVYLGNYLPVNAPQFAKTKLELLSDYIPHILRLNRDFELAWVTDSWLFKAPFAQPIVTRDYAQNIPPHETPMRGLFLANMFQVFPQDRGQNYSIRLAENVVRNLLEVR
jgi:protoporphyrinogen oxidase